MLERKKLIAEMSRVVAAKNQMDYVIEERMEEIRRLQASMAIQEAAEAELLKKLKELEEKGE